ncbi:MAG: histidinol-phosphatase HisJ family protein [Verrucomicrobiia bacterium]
MRLPADYHMHTPLCKHAVGEVFQYAQRAAEIGLNEIGFSDHAPMPQDDFDDWRMKFSELESYVNSVLKARQDFPQLTIRLGLEIDFIPGYENWIEKISSLYKWDYLIGSVHYVDSKWDIDNPKKIDEWKKRRVTQVWENYIIRLTEAAESGFFDIIGHIDLAKKFGHFPENDCSDLFRIFFKRARENNCLIEINTAGLRKECKEIYPAKSILKIANEERVGITFGSDAHSPEEVGMNFREAIDLAKSCGYTSCFVFESRKRKEMPLP